MATSQTLRAQQQRGISLIFALMTLVALALASAALIRSVDSGTLVLGNLGFKQDTLLTADDATRTALVWLNNNAAAEALQNDGAAGTGYYATVNTALDATGTSTSASRVIIDWDNNDCAASAGTFATCLKASNPALTLSNSVTARYVIIRLCNATGAVSAANVHCAKPMSAGAVAATHLYSLSYATPKLLAPTASSSPYYRILVRTQGGRNTVTYTETLVHF